MKESDRASDMVSDMASDMASDRERVTGENTSAHL
jgi:hypothetical protein